MKIHFIYVVGPKSPKFGLIYYISIFSFLKMNPNATVYLHTNEEPIYSAWYLRLKSDPGVSDRFIVVGIDPDVLSETDKLGIKDITHKADFIRLNVLLRHGGLYSDLDNVCLQNLEWMQSYDRPAYSIELEMNYTFGSISNGLMYHPKDSDWTLNMIKLYRDYDPKDGWVETSIMKPTEIYKLDPSKVIGIPAGFIDPVTWKYDDRQDLFMHDRIRFNDSWVLHLCESLNCDYFKYIDLEHIMTVNTSFTRVVRRFVEHFWDSDQNRSKISKYA